MARYKSQRIRDPLHDLVEFDATQFENVMWSVVQSRPFQRLRRVKQLGFSELVFPGATHTRFAHSIGVFHIARRLMKIIENHLAQDGFERHRAEVALAAALVHDVGHGPFSHAFEDAGKKLDIPYTKHEFISADLISNSDIADVLRPLADSFASEVANLIKVDRPTDIYSAVVTSQFDADRLDYIQRDPLMAGTKHSRIDFTWLMSNIEVGEVAQGVDEEYIGKISTFVLNEKAFYAAEAYILGLFHLYPTVYFHKATRSAEKIFSHLLLRLYELVTNDSIGHTGLQKKNPLIKFLIEPNQENFLCLDDTVVWANLHEMVDAEDVSLKNLSARLRDRNLLKSVDVRYEFIRILGSPVDEERIDKYCALANEAIQEWVDGQPELLPRIIVDEGNRPTYRRLGDDKGPLNQIHIRSRHDLVDVSNISKVVAASGTFKFMRAYVDQQDGPAKSAVHEIIKKIAKGDSAQ